MKLLEKIKRMRDLRKLRSKVEQQPSPESLARLAETYIAAGRVEDAHLTAKRGMARFPASERLASICRYALKQKHGPALSQLRDEISQQPTPDCFRALAEIHMELEDQDRALEVCEECLDLFPDFDTANMIIGEIRLRRFFQHRISLDGLEAERQLRRSLRFNHKNTRAVTLLAQLYFAVGARSSMEDLFNTVLRTGVPAREVADLSKAANARRFWDRLPNAGYADGTEGYFSDRARGVEVSGQFAIPPHQFPGSPLQDSATIAASWARLDEKQLHDNVLEAGRAPGVHCLTVLAGENRALVSYSDEEYLTKEEFAELVREIYETSDESTRRMDVGSFDWCTIEGDGRGVALHKVRTICLGMLFEHPVKPTGAHQVLQQIASRNFIAPGEVAHA